MVDILNIDDHMALPCECGSVNFVLLKSGFVECANCLNMLDNVGWSLVCGKVKASDQLIKSIKVDL